MTLMEGDALENVANDDLDGRRYFGKERRHRKMEFGTRSRAKATATDCIMMEFGSE